ncbi:MAG: PilZ domain-containing protein [Sphingomonadaceae bacterium]|nr:PilZ domain-containing protein [Sphingomonadaceae bacterium]
MSQFRRVDPALVEQRRGPRHRVRITRATVRPDGEAPLDAILHDLSLYGCRIRSPVGHLTGEQVWLRFQGSVPIAATVVWSDAKFAGCRFDAPIEKSLLRALTLVTY